MLANNNGFEHIEIAQKCCRSRNFKDCREVADKSIIRSLTISHNVLSASPLFDGNLPAHTNESLLVGEIEPRLDLTKWSQKSTLDTHVVADLMSKMWQMPLT